MMARWYCTALVSALLCGSGCCCLPCGPCGPCAPRCCLLACLPCFREPIRWDGCCNDCGPSACESCGDRCGGCPDCGLLSHCGPLGGLRWCWSCNRGCGEIYKDEWYSDPPDCCDPCDRCYGQFTGPGAYCCLGPFQRMLACLHHYKYCPPPNCGPWRPIFGHCSPCASSCGPAPCGCGDPGCSSCAGGAPHGADIYYNGPVGPTPVPSAVPTTATRTTRAPQAESASHVQEEYEVPSGRPQPGRSTYRPGPQPWSQLSGRLPQKMSPAEVAARQAAQKKKAVVGAGVRQANYQP
jgi:hypothetical protein